MAHNRLHITQGDKYGRLVIITEVDKAKTKRAFLCRCNCGKEVIVKLNSLRTGHTKSCGCLDLECFKSMVTKHGQHSTLLYWIHGSMKERCRNPRNKSYKNYGGRGIEVCKEWSADFAVFLKWAMQNGYRQGLTIERVNVNGNYEPSNCTWIPMADQCKNKRNSKVNNPEI